MIRLRYLVPCVIGIVCLAKLPVFAQTDPRPPSVDAATASGTGGARWALRHVTGVFTDVDSPVFGNSWNDDPRLITGWGLRFQPAASHWSFDLTRLRRLPPFKDILVETGTQFSLEVNYYPIRIKDSRDRMIRPYVSAGIGRMGSYRGKAALFQGGFGFEFFRESVSVPIGVTWEHWRDPGAGPYRGDVTQSRQNRYRATIGVNIFLN